MPKKVERNWREALGDTSLHDCEKAAFEALSWGMLNIITNYKTKEEERDNLILLL
jgi:hypothetical protein